MADRAVPPETEVTDKPAAQAADAPARSEGAAPATPEVPAAPAAPAAPAPVAPDGGSPDDAPAAPKPAGAPVVDVAALDAEATPASETAAPQKTETARWKTILAALGDIPDEPHEKALEAITEKTIAKLPDDAKAVLRHLLAQRAKEQRDAVAARAAEEKAIADARAELTREGRALMAREAEFAALFNSEAVKAIIGKADAPLDGIDPMTPDGQRALVERSTAEAFRAFTKPLVDKAGEVQRRAAYHAFKESHPRMANGAFVKEMTAELEARKAAGKATDLADIHAIVEGRLLLREDNARREADRKAREASAAHVARETSESDPGSGSPIPEWVKTKGYKGETGNQALVKFLRDHPKARAAAMRASFGS